MLTISSLPEGCSYSTSRNFSVDFFVNGVVSKVANGNPLWGPWLAGNPAIPQTLLRLHGYITTGSERNYCDDRPCYHRQIDGIAKAVPFDQKQVFNSTYLNDQFAVRTGPTSWVQYSRIVGPNEEHVERYQTIGGTITQNVIVRYASNDDTILTMIAYAPVNTSSSWVVTWQACKYLSGFRYYQRTSLITVSKKTESYVLSYPIPLTGWRSGTTLCPITPIVVPIDKAALRLSLLGLTQRRVLEDFLPEVLKPEDPDLFGDLAQRCIEQVRYVDVNTLAYVNDFRHIGSLIPKFAQWKKPKTWASAWLTMKYGLGLTIKDTQELADAIHVAATTASAMQNCALLYATRTDSLTTPLGVVFEEDHYKLAVDPYPDSLRDMSRKMMVWGLYPTLTNIWDMIPYSFVLDWFKDVSSLLERIDTQDLVEKFQIHGICRSRKIWITVPISQLAPGFPGEGSVTLTSYRREIPNHIDLPRWRIDSPEDFNNWVELLSIFVQKAT